MSVICFDMNMVLVVIDLQKGIVVFFIVYLVVLVIVCICELFDVFCSCGLLVVLVNVVGGVLGCIE